jgi:hypothetical protein
MNTHFQIKLSTLAQLFGSPEAPNLLPGQPNCATSLDYGFDFDEEELEMESAASTPSEKADASIPTVSADEFDLLYRWFIS